MNLPHNSWETFFKNETSKPYFKNLEKILVLEYTKYKVFPKKEDIFTAFKLTPLESLKAVIIGQDPYHNEGEAHGLAFSSLASKRPPSLKNIFKELETDLGIKRDNNNLTDWAKQGVFLLNTILTVRKNEPLSHKQIGWEIFTDEVIKTISDNTNKTVFVLWGNNAKQKKKLINLNKHIIIESAHPSPLSFKRGFEGSKPFSKINNLLDEKINW
jgi:uracil-DNA glycosylase